MELRINPSWVQLGSHVLSNNREIVVDTIVKYENNSYRFVGKDNLGNIQEINTRDSVTLLK